MHKFSEINWVKNLADKINKNFDTIILLDGSENKRFSRFHSDFNFDDATTICIDHHPNTNFTYNLSEVNPNVSSTTQLIYTSLYIGAPGLISHQIAKILLVGIITDSGFFQYIEGEKAKALPISYKIASLGKIDLQSLVRKLKLFTENELKIYRTLIDNLTFIKSDLNDKLMYSFLSLEVLNQFTLVEIENAENLFKENILRLVKNYNWGFVLTPKSHTQVSVSFRSVKGSINVSLLAKKFGGGGHVYAAACRFPLDSTNRTHLDIISKVVNLILSEKLELA